MKLGVTGHQKLANEARVRDALKEVVNALLPTIGLTSLAAGTDQLFAEVCRELGVFYHVVIPASQYALSFEKESDRRSFEALLATAKEVTVLPFDAPSELAYLAAGRWIAESSDVVVAVWDGLPSEGVGGTADIVKYVKTLGKTLRVIEERRQPQG